MPKNINSISIIITLQGIEKIKTVWVNWREQLSLQVEWLLFVSETGEKLASCHLRFYNL